MMKLTLWSFIAMVGLMPFHAPAQTTQAKSQAQDATEAAMRIAYERLKNQITADDENVALEESQRAWIKERDEACSVQQAPCLMQRNVERRYFLEGRSVNGLSASSAIRPFFTHKTDDKKGVEISATRLKFTNPKTPAELVLNEFMDKQLQEAVRHARSTNPPSKEEKYYSLMTSELNFASPKLLSARVDGDFFVGQAHPEPWGESINIDMNTGKILDFNDLLDVSKAKKIFFYCQKQVNTQKIKNLDDPKKGNVTIKEISESTSDLGMWKFKKSGASVSYGAYAFGGYSQCNCSCNIPYSVLHPLAKKTFPLPKQK